MIGQKFIDLELTQQLLDHLGVVVIRNETVSEAAETRRGFTFGVRLPWAIGGSGESGKADKAERQFEIPSARPTKLTSLALEGCRRDGSLIDLDSDPDSAVSARAPIVFTAELEQASSADLGEMLTTLLQMSDANMLENEFEETEEVRWMLGTNEASRVLPLIGMLPDGRNLIVLAREKSILPDYEAEDLLDDRRCFGVVERIVPDGGEVDLSRFLFSGLNRTVRRAIEKPLENAVARMAEATGGTKSLQVPGPAIVVRAAVIA